MVLIGVLLLAFLLVILVRLVFCHRLQPILCGRIALVLLLLFMAVLQFVYGGSLVQVVPPSSTAGVLMPSGAEYGAGVLGCLLAVGLCIRPLRRLTAWVLIGILLVLLPIHIYAAFEHGGGHPKGGSYFAFTIPFQIVLLVWTWFFAAHKE